MLVVHVARITLGRTLTEAEIKAIADTLPEALAWFKGIHQAIRLCQRRGTVGPAARGR